MLETPSRSIAIAGTGATGVEVAGELAAKHNGIGGAILEPTVARRPCHWRQEGYRTGEKETNGEVPKLTCMELVFLHLSRPTSWTNMDYYRAHLEL